MMAVFDLEGTITKSAHREQLRHDKKFDEYNSKLLEDAPNTEIISRVRTLFQANFDIVILTAKPEKYHDDVEAWLSMNNVPYDVLVMRKNYDNRTSVEIKEEFVLRNKSHIIKAFDDRDDILSMYKGYDIEAIKVKNS